jgi:hypothetical protein
MISEVKESMYHLFLEIDFSALVLVALSSFDLFLAGAVTFLVAAIIFFNNSGSDLKYYFLIAI